MKSEKLTKKQVEHFATVEKKLPDGYYYNLHDDADAPKYYADNVWGVSVYNDELDPGGPLAHAQINAGRVIGATYFPEKHDLLKKLLNRACAALWHKQPLWEE